MKRRLRRAFIAISGSIVVVIGIILIPYPGPGWVVVFAGLGILATEFDRAKKLLDYVKGKYDSWLAWIARQNIAVRIGVWLLTAFVVIVTVWLINGYGVINDLFHLGANWVDSPFVK